MNDPTERKYEIEIKLEKEINNVNLLKERAVKSSNLTKGMVNILSSFEHRLARLEETILPVYNQTGNLQKRQENIERTLKALDHVIGFYGVSQEVEPVIRAGPGLNANGDSGLETFLKAMDKLQAAMEYFQTHNSESVELDNVRSCFSDGGDALNREFKDLLHRHNKPVPPVVLLDLVSPEEDTPMEETAPSLNHLPDHVCSELTRIAEWLITHNRDEYINVYATLRGNVLHKSLQHLKEHQRTSSGGSVQGIAATNSPMVRAKFQTRHETPSRRASKRIQHVFEKKANKMLLKASQTLEHSTGLTLGPRRSGLLLAESREDVVDEQEMENYLVCVMALQKLMQSERMLMVGIVPLDLQPRAFEILIRDALNMVVQDGENIAARAKRCINRHDFAAVLVVFPILKHLQTMRPEFDRIVKGCSEHVTSKFSSIHSTLHATAAKALDDFMDSIRSDPSTQLPKDGTVHELTSNMLVFLEQLLDYVDTIGGVLAQNADYNAALGLLPGAFGRADKNKILLGMYIQNVLTELNQTLCNKSDLYSDVYLRAVFRLNNNYYVLKSLQRSGLIDLIQLSKPNFEASYHKMISENKEAYTQSWSKVLRPLEDASSTTTNASKLRDKDRHLIKEYFAGFNKEMEEIVKVQHGYSIPDVELRESLKRDNKEYILPKYHAFYEKFSKVPFTKNPEKYIKYTPAQVSAMIDQFFDVAA
ncbi:exocyst complex component 7 isoform X2 [Anabrus simplex]|uniref:exocyst complex component 7 isoform X2 n=1 Tax=Anabrus simplex TaxID=316456 RepID=UPI0034DCCD7A